MCAIWRRRSGGGPHQVSRPKRCIRRSIDGSNRVLGEFASPRVCRGLQGVTLKPEASDAAVLPSHPHFIFCTSRNRINRVILQTHGFNLPDPALRKLEQSAIPRCKPNAPLRVNVNRSTVVRGQSFRTQISGKPTVAVALNCSRPANPQVAFAVFE
jgi:hypothetical protein